MNEVAALMYKAFSAGGYAPSWSTAPHKDRWRAAAVAVLNEFESGEQS